MDDPKPRRGRPPKSAATRAAPVSSRPEVLASPPVVAAAPVAPKPELPKREPVKPVKVEPVKAEPLKAAPAKAGAVTVEPFKAKAVRSRPVKAEAPAPLPPAPPAAPPPAIDAAPAETAVIESVVAEAPAPTISVPLEPDPLPAAVAPAPATEGKIEMATVIENAKPAAEKVQAMFGDINGRAKAAMEKSTKLGEEMTELAKGNVEAMVASGRIAAKGMETMAQDAAEYGKKSFESATTAFKSMSSVKSPTELFQLQSDYAKTSFDSAVAEASRLSELWVKLAGDVFQPLSSRYALAAEKIKGATAL